jgi:hypothetical protein
VQQPSNFLLPSIKQSDLIKERKTKNDIFFINKEKRVVCNGKKKNNGKKEETKYML